MICTASVSAADSRAELPNPDVMPVRYFAQLDARRVRANTAPMCVIDIGVGAG